ncbi:hypothetical protein [Reyranella soli]|jgi:hypothetical protein|uniref:Lipoprotein n=1 Tax=Reyranella soli TaxID=1230389 RepID=A0A512NPH1_9HYPH|nr:hypothetical protein [Reyranella soli]GEP60844.1 hypothetical protein RSO01_80100 [Reyranella soli]
MTRTLIVLALSFGLAACGGAAPSQTWKKAGAGDATIASDTALCRAAAQQQASRLYPHTSGNPGMSGAGMISAQQAANTDRNSAEIEIFNDCMQGKGYAR